MELRSADMGPEIEKHEVGEGSIKARTTKEQSVCSSGLLVCPFCGGAPVILSSKENTTRKFVTCSDCRIRNILFTEREWNSRAD